MTDYQPGYQPAYPPSPWPSPPPPPGVPARRRVRPLALGAAVLGVLVVGAAIGLGIGLLTRGNPSTQHSSGASTVAQARSLFQQALVATRSSAGVHYVGVSSDGTSTQKTVGDATRDGGLQVITITSSSGTEQFTLRLVGGTVYFQGNTPAIEDQLGVPASSASSVQGKWVAVSSGDGPYSVLQPGITVADQTVSIALVPTSTTQVTAADGTKVIRILGTATSQQGRAGGTAHMDIAADSHLPIAQVSTVTVNGVTLTSQATFSGWGKPVAPVAPTGAVAWSTLGASAPPGGYGSGGAGGGGSGPTPAA